jgi:hypothetical protein
MKLDNLEAVRAIAPDGPDTSSLFINIVISVAKLRMFDLGNQL